MKIGLPENDSTRCRSPATTASSARKASQFSIIAALVVRRKRWILTWKARLLVLTVMVVLAAVVGRNLGTFLCQASPVGGQFLVVEGWMPSYAYQEAAAEFRKGGYQKVIAAGTLNWDPGGELRQHFGGEHLVRFGIPRELVVVTSSDEIRHDRTFHAAMAVKQWLREQGLQTTSIDIVSIGPHARRSRLLYQKALGDKVRVGVIAIQDRRFDPDHWWQSSVGARSVVGETIAYLYARLLFWPPQ